MNARRAMCVAVLLIAAVAVPAPGPASASEAQGSNMRLVGYSDLQGRSAFQPVIVVQKGRWIAYVGHHGGQATNAVTAQNEANGTSILDVTDPRQPRFLHHIPTESSVLTTSGEGSGAQMVQVCAGKDLPKGDPAKFYMLRAVGSEAHEVWDVTTPEKPARITTVAGNLKSTHAQWWECDTGIAYLVSGLPEWQVRRITQVFDLSDPAKPVFIRNFALPGQQPGAPKPKNPRFRDGHGPISAGPKHNRLYFGYGNIGDGTLQIVDREKLLKGPPEPTPENLLYPQISLVPVGRWQAIHAVYPLLGMEIGEFAKNTKGRVRDFLLVMPEAIENECHEERQLLFVVDITNEAEPFGVANFQVPEKSGDYCSRGGRFGPHSTNQNLTPIYYRRIVFVAWFNAGVRALDVRDPFNLKEIGYYVPATTAKTEPSCVKAEGKERCKAAIVTNTVEVDDRGYIYIVDRAGTGMHILEVTGDARKIANFSK